MALSRKWVIAGGALALVAAGGATAAWFIQREATRERLQWAATLTGGKPELAEAHILRYGCAGCHDIPGVGGPEGFVGPPLGTVGKRIYIAGVMTNTPSNRVRWIMDPPSVDPMTAMPVTGISETEARDVAAYLYSLR